MNQVVKIRVSATTPLPENLSEDRILQRLEALTELAKQRRIDAGENGFAGGRGGDDLHFLTTEERATLHSLRLMLPSFGEAAIMAKARIAARLTSIRALRAPCVLRA